MTASHPKAPLWQMARRAERMNPSVIREILKITERPGIISFAGRRPAFAATPSPIDATFAQACARASCATTRGSRAAVRGE